MIHIDLPSDADLAQRVAAAPPEQRAQVELALRHQMATLRYVCALPDLARTSQALDALLGSYATLVLSAGGSAQALQVAANHLMRLSMSVASVANAVRQQETQAAFDLGAMPASPHTH